MRGLDLRHPYPERDLLYGQHAAVSPEYADKYQEMRIVYGLPECDPYVIKLPAWTGVASQRVTVEKVARVAADAVRGFYANLEKKVQQVVPGACNTRANPQGLVPLSVEYRGEGTWVVCLQNPK